MTEQHPITPSHELVEQWFADWNPYSTELPRTNYVATQAARWGSDQELEACCKDIIEIIAGVFAGRIIDDWDQFVEFLRDVRRPQPPTLKEQAFDALKDLSNGIERPDSWETIRRALEALDD